MNAPITLPERDRIIIALRTWIRQRPGLEFGNYGDVAAYRAECRSIARDLREARTLLDYVEAHPDITADMLREAFRSAYSGRLSWDGDRSRLEYCTGQYWPTEYRRAACAVLASAIWNHYREWTLANDQPRCYTVTHWDSVTQEGAPKTFATFDEANAYANTFNREHCPHVWAQYGAKLERLGDYLRRQLRGTFGASIQRRWFN